MNRQTIPRTNNRLYYFEISSINKNNRGRPLIFTDEKGETNYLDDVKQASDKTQISPTIIYSFLNNKKIIRNKKYKKIDFKWAD